MGTAVCCHCVNINEQKTLQSKLCVYTERTRCMTRVATNAWIVWNFQKDTQPIFDNDVLDLGIMFPQFRNVYRVSLTKKNTQQFMQMWRLQYEPYGIPCQHILQITNKIEDNMAKIQHWKVYGTHFGDDSELSAKLMESRSIQQNNETNGVPITAAMFRKIMCPHFGWA